MCLRPGGGYGTVSFATDGYSSSVEWTNASYDADGFPIFGYSYGRPVYGYTSAGAAVFTIAALTALCFVPHWNPAPWYHGHHHYPAHIHRVSVPPHFPHGHRPANRPPGGIHAPIHRNPGNAFRPNGHRTNVGHNPFGNRPQVNNNRPGNKPNVSNRSHHNRPQANNNRPGNRPNVSNRSHHNRPQANNNRPGNRPNVSNRSHHNRPQANNNRPGNRNGGRRH